MTQEIKVEVSSGNVFADLELPNSEEMLIKAELASKIGEIIETRSLTQMDAAEILGIDQPKVSAAELASKIGEIVAIRNLTQMDAAEILGIDQPKVSALIRGRLTGFSIERLFKFLNALGSDVEISVKPKPKSRTAAITTVIEN